MQVSLVDGTVVDRWPEFMPVSEQDAVGYLAMHFRRLDRAVLAAALTCGRLVTSLAEGSTTFIVEATISASPVTRPSAQA